MSQRIIYLEQRKWIQWYFRKRNLQAMWRIDSIKLRLKTWFRSKLKYVSSPGRHDNWLHQGNGYENGYRMDSRNVSEISDQQDGEGNGEGEIQNDSLVIDLIIYIDDTTIKWLPTSIFLGRGKFFHGQRILVSYSSWSYKESNMTVTNTFTTFFTIYRDVDSEKQKVDLGGEVEWGGNDEFN